MEAEGSAFPRSTTCSTQWSSGVVRATTPPSSIHRGRHTLFFPMEALRPTRQHRLLVWPMGAVVARAFVWHSRRLHGLHRRSRCRVCVCIPCPACLPASCSAPPLGGPDLSQQDGIKTCTCCVPADSDHRARLSSSYPALHLCVLFLYFPDACCGGEQVLGPGLEVRIRQR